jgi:hypothetical protein
MISAEEDLGEGSLSDTSLGTQFSSFTSGTSSLPCIYFSIACFSSGSFTFRFRKRGKISIQGIYNFT